MRCTWYPAAAQTGVGNSPGRYTSRTKTRRKPHNSRAIAVTAFWALRLRPAWASESAAESFLRFERSPARRGGAT